MVDKLVLEKASEYIESEPGLNPALLVLEAGCGSAQHVRIPFSHKLVGIDIDTEQLENNRALDEKILGDLQTFELPRAAFDLVICVDVLEHLRHPGRAMENLTQCLRPNGYMLIAGPEPYSFKGFVAKYTPHFLRRLIFRVLTGESYKILLKGQVQKTFFPTYLKPLSSRKNLIKWAKQNGFTIVYEDAYDSHTDNLYKVHKFSVTLFRAVNGLVLSLTRGKTNLLLADYVLLLRKGADLK